MANGVAIISGGTKGLGLALVEKCLQEGWAVATCARSDVEIATLRARHPAEVLLAEKLDISRSDECDEFINKVHDRFGPTDVLINNASILGPRTKIESYNADEWQQTMEINVNGAFFMTRAVLSAMLERRAGVIINVSSGAGIKGKAGWGAYATSKFAIEGFTQVLRDEVQDRGIRVHVIDPGAMRTQMRADAYPEEDPMTLPEPRRIASVIFDIAAVYEPQLCRLTAKDYM